MATLILPVKRKWFDMIRSGEKVYEYRLRTDYWKNRLERRIYDRVVVTLGYPKRDDKSRRLEFMWRGYELQRVFSDEWGGEARDVYAIKLIPAHPDSAQHENTET